MLKRIAIVGLVAASLAMAPAAQAAPFLTGGFSFSSVGAGPGLTPLVPVDSTGMALTTFTAATALDFTLTGAKTPGVVGGFKVDSTSGDFDPLYGKNGLIKDFTFFGALQPNYPTLPIVDFQTMSWGSPTTYFSFDLNSVAVQNRDINLLTLTGAGLFHLTGFADTPGSFYFSGNNAGGTFSYSASEAAMPPVPEPASMLLFGTGLIGLAGAVRRRAKK